METPNMIMTASQRLWTALSPAQQMVLGEKWDNRNKDPLAYVPHEKRATTTRKAALAANEKLGQDAVAYVTRFLEQSSDEDKLRRLFRRKKSLGVGGGCAYDVGWLRPSVQAGFLNWWVDVSQYSCEKIQESLDSQWRDLRRELDIRYPGYVVKNAEIQTALQDPTTIGLEIEDVELWYVCRTLGCLLSNAAKTLLYTMGKTMTPVLDPDKKTTVIIIGALKDHNPTRKGKTSKLYAKREILSGIRRGAECNIDIVDEDSSIEYFDQKYSALTIRAV